MDVKIIIEVKSCVPAFREDFIEFDATVMDFVRGKELHISNLYERNFFECELDRAFTAAKELLKEQLLKGELENDTKGHNKKRKRVK